MTCAIITRTSINLYLFQPKSDTLRKTIPSIWQWSNDLQCSQSSGHESQFSQVRYKLKETSIDVIDKLAVLKEVSQEETLAIEDDLLSTYTDQSPPPKRQKSHQNDDDEVTLSNNTPTRNPFCLPKNSTNDSTKPRSLTKTLSPVKKPVPIIEKRKLTNNPGVRSRFFRKTVTKTAIKIDDIDNTSQKEIQEKFQHVKSLYNNSVSDALSLYTDLDVSEDQDRKSDYDKNREHVTQSDCDKNREPTETNEVIEIKSDSEENPTATVNKTLNKFIYQKDVSYFTIN